MIQPFHLEGTGHDSGPAVPCRRHIPAGDVIMEINEVGWCRGAGLCIKLFSKDSNFACRKRTSARRIEGCNMVEIFQLTAGRAIGDISAFYYYLDVKEEMVLSARRGP